MKIVEQVIENMFITFIMCDYGVEKTNWINKTQVV
jgi:hypothetical protein